MQTILNRLQVIDFVSNGAHLTAPARRALHLNKLLMRVFDALHVFAQFGIQSAFSIATARLTGEDRQQFKIAFTKRRDIRRLALAGDNSARRLTTSYERRAQRRGDLRRAEIAQQRRIAGHLHRHPQRRRPRHRATQQSNIGADQRGLRKIFREALTGNQVQLLIGFDVIQSGTRCAELSCTEAMIIERKRCGSVSASKY